VLDAGEGAERLGDRGLVRAGRARRGRGGGGVLAVVRAGDQRLRRERVVGRELDATRRARDLAEAARDDGDVRLRLVLEDAQLRRAVRLERAVAVEVVGLEVEQDGDVAGERLDVDRSPRLHSTSTRLF
jgi:hypothetical protein